jgi:glutamate N-acetyltransferase/amino-acid N-acetyltransferase
MKKNKKINNGICSPIGFYANGIYAGIKKNNKKDLALIYSRKRATAVGFFTTNKFKSESILVSKGNLKDGYAQTIVIISGNANCANGEKGVKDAKLICKEVASKLNIKEDDVLIASTGKIGVPLPTKKIKEKIPHLVKGISKRKSSLCARTIMTTDTYPKEISFLVEDKIKIGGIAKGAGMISPNFATMLCFVTTDADIEMALLKKIVKNAISFSFNHISVDNEMSTNDTIFVLANGESNVKVKNKSQIYYPFKKAMERVFFELSQLIVLDGEGASSLIKIEILNAKDEETAEKIARRISSSPLFKSSIYGKSANWGRIISAIGSLGLNLNKNFDIYYGNVKVVSNGVSSYKNRLKAENYLKRRNKYEIKIDLKEGKEKYWLYTTDLTPKYVELNKC